MGTSFVKTDATITGTAGFSFDSGSSAEGPPEHVPRKRKPAKKNLALRRGLEKPQKKLQRFNVDTSPLTLTNKLNP
jgi:hypothetical protein